MDELKGKLLADIRKTGFPSELLVESKFTRRGWQASTHEYYVDREVQKGREIDSLLRYVIRDSKRSPSVSAIMRLYAEVKKSTKSWVVFTSPKPKIETMLTGQLVAVQNTGSPKAVLNPFEKTHVTHRSPRCGRAVHIAFTNDDSRAFGAIVSASKAAIEGHRNAASEEGFFSKDSSDALFYLPVVILDGQLMECHLDQNGDLQIEEAPYLPFRFNYSSPEYSDQYACHVDLVALSALDEYIERIEDALKTVYIEMISCGKQTAQRYK